MKPTLIVSAALAALLAASIYAFGDIARPKPTTEPRPVFYTGLTVTSDAKASEARLQISQETLKRIQEAAARNGGENISTIERIRHSSTRTMMAGLFMFLAVSFAGVWLARSGQRRQNKVVAASVLVAIVFGLATVIVRANAGPPGYIRWQNLPQSLKDGKATSGGVDIEIVQGDENIKLIIPLRKSN